MKKYELIPTDFNLADHLENAPSYDHLHSVMSRCMQEVFQQREDQILKILKENGFEFENKFEMGQFAKTRRTIERYPNTLIK